MLVKDLPELEQQQLIKKAQQAGINGNLLNYGVETLEQKINTPKNPIEALLLQIKDVSKFTDEQLQSLKSITASEEIKRNREKMEKAQQIVEITDFNDPRVDPYSPNAVYSVYNEITNTLLKVSGRTLEHYISCDDIKYNAFKAKRRGHKIDIDNKEFIFEKYEHRGI